jgi:hypothetical protein
MRALLLLVALSSPAFARCHGYPPGVAPIAAWHGRAHRGHLTLCITEDTTGLLPPYREFLYGYARCRGRCAQHAGTLTATLQAVDPGAQGPVGPLTLTGTWGTCAIAGALTSRDALILSGTLSCPGRPPAPLILSRTH